jgi:hypothetical protein
MARVKNLIKGNRKNSDTPKRPISAMLCVREERLAKEKDPCLAQRIDPDVDICYCEAKHVQSFYAGIARGENADFDGYEGRVLILDEVDALVIDEEPNEAFVYPNKDLSEMATDVADALKRGTPVDEVIINRSHPAAARVVREMTSEWEVGRSMKTGEDFVYAKEVGKYCKVRGGRANLKEWNLALECRNFQDGHSRKIFYQERLFVMSRPRVFRKYYRILGLSGSIGSEAERKFLQETYRAVFFEVPPFLKTCKGSPFHTAAPAKLGSQHQAVYVESTPDAQLQRLAEVALEARNNVPVLVIAKDRSTAEAIVGSLRLMARSRGLGSASDDVVRSLSRTLYEQDPEQWKENLNKATLPLGAEGGINRGSGSWRITVTDPRGGRGTDYRVDDKDVDSRGGLLLIPMIVPTSQRDWIQFLGRTARQDRKGQFCAVLCGTDYQALSAKYKTALTGGQDLKAVETILSWGDREVTERIQGSAALYNCGVRVNELCEEIFGHRADLLQDNEIREMIVSSCQSFRYMSVGEINEAFGRIPGLEVGRVLTEACDLGRAIEPPVGQAVQGKGGGQSSAKTVLFCLDWSASMLSQDTGTRLTRFETCIRSVRAILKAQVLGRDNVGVVGFGTDVKVVLAPTLKSEAANLDKKIGALSPSTAGGTCFYDAVVESLQLMNTADPRCPRWLVCLTDGDDLGSKAGNSCGQLVTKMLDTGDVKNLNMVMITVGKLAAKNLQVIDGWVEQVKNTGGFGEHVSAQDASKIEMAFEVVAECLAADVGGAVEC